jgi:2-oxoglutarate dehydrogenase E1 component
LLQKLTEIPDDFHLNRKLKRSVERRRAMAEGAESVDWSAAEALAIATLAVEGHPVRLAGQDSTRGTFSQRHAVLHDVVTGCRYEIFRHLSDNQANVEILNSPLCEAAAMGFEYGYSLDSPEVLVAWEGQFGDFANAAQVIIDQFLASAEDKWRWLSGLVLLLPHGFEGQGPEHSSARLERFLTLAGEHNLQIVSPSTPAQYFHVLRRQTLWRWRKPLIDLTPKSLLRHPQVVSPLDDLTQGGFQRILPDERRNPGKTTRILLCSGKVYYDLLHAREERSRPDVALIRIEQFYPLPEKQLRKTLDTYPDDLPVYWVQEEPENMGAWGHWRWRHCGRLFDRFPFDGVFRPESASPATGSSASHQREQSVLIARAFGEQT